MRSVGAIINNEDYMGQPRGMPYEARRKLKEIDYHLYFEWNKKRDCWHVKYKRMGFPAYTIMAVANDDYTFRPVDNRVFNHLRWLYYINRNITRHIQDELNRQEYEKIRDERFEDEQCKQAALQEMRRPMQMFERDVGLAPGKVKLPYSPGFGNGK